MKMAGKLVYYNSYPNSQGNAFCFNHRLYINVAVAVCIGAGLKPTDAPYGQCHLFCLEPGFSREGVRGVAFQVLPD